MNRFWTEYRRLLKRNNIINITYYITISDIMDDIETIAKRWGASLAVIIPKEIAEKEQIKEGDRIHIKVEKHADLSHIFGKAKIHVSAQKFKDMCREGWE